MAQDGLNFSTLLRCKLKLIETNHPKNQRKKVIPVVFKLDEAVSVFNDNIPDAAVTFKESLDVAIPNIVRNISDVNTLALHCQDLSEKTKQIKHFLSIAKKQDKKTKSWKNEFGYFCIRSEIKSSKTKPFSLKNNHFISKRTFSTKKSACKL